jgi:hypothetical protein
MLIFNDIFNFNVEVYDMLTYIHKYIQFLIHQILNISISDISNFIFIIFCFMSMFILIRIIFMYLFLTFLIILFLVIHFSIIGIRFVRLFILFRLCFTFFFIFFAFIASGMFEIMGLRWECGLWISFFSYSGCWNSSQVLIIILYVIIVWNRQGTV